MIDPRPPNPAEGKSSYTNEDKQTKGETNEDINHE
jgi:hypothetical protein